MTVENKDQNMDRACPICDSTDFVEGAKEYEKTKGKSLKCVNCGSLEWDRAARMVWNTLRGGFSRCMALQLSGDRALPEKFFPNTEHSFFGQEGSLNPECISRPAAFYDIVVCNHVLEYLENDRAAIAELLRILKPGSGLLQLAVSNSQELANTEEYLRTNSDKKMRLRTYGRDFLQQISESCSFKALTVEAIDPVSGAKELLYFMSKTEDSLQALQKKLQFSYKLSFFPE